MTCRAAQAQPQDPAAAAAWPAAPIMSHPHIPVSYLASQRQRRCTIDGVRRTGLLTLRLGVVEAARAPEPAVAAVSAIFHERSVYAPVLKVSADRLVGHCRLRRRLSWMECWREAVLLMPLVFSGGGRRELCLGGKAANAGLFCGPKSNAPRRVHSIHHRRVTPWLRGDLTMHTADVI